MTGGAIYFPIQQTILNIQGKKLCKHRGRMRSAGKASTKSGSR